MSRWVIGPFWSRFLDSRAPMFFIIGSIVLAILGNAVYSAIIYAFGDRPLTLVGIVVGAIVVLPAIVAGFRSALQAWGRGRATVFQPEEQLQPHQGLILLLSPNPLAAEKQAITHHLAQQTLGYCWLITSPAVVQTGKVSDLKLWLNEQNVYAYDVLIDDANQAQATYTAVAEALRRAQTLLPKLASIIVDITGGTKPMSAGAALACRDYGVAMQYMVTQRSQEGNPIGAAVPVQVRIDEAPLEETT